MKIVSERRAGRPRNSGLVVFDGEFPLPAKEVLRESYRIAKALGENEDINFSSGTTTLNVLRNLGFRAERLGVEKEADGQASDTQ
jgi:hypothetical protein